MKNIDNYNKLNPSALCEEIIDAANDPEVAGSLRLKMMVDRPVNHTVDQVIDGVVYEMRAMTQSDLSVIHSEDPAVADNNGWHRSKVQGFMKRIKPSEQVATTFSNIFTHMPEATEDERVMLQPQAEMLYKELLENPPAEETPFTTALRALFQKA